LPPSSPRVRVHPLSPCIRPVSPPLYKQGIVLPLYTGGINFICIGFGFDFPLYTCGIAQRPLEGSVSRPRHFSTTPRLRQQWRPRGALRGRWRGDCESQISDCFNQATPRNRAITSSHTIRFVTQQFAYCRLIKVRFT